MKKFYFSLVAVMVATVSFAQSSLIATLTHEGNVSVFHGPSSYKQAMAAAADGDIISLAGGIYEATNITKGIILRGSGVEKDTISNAYPTQIQGEFSINIPDSCTSLVIEGVYFSNRVICTNIKNPTFMKSRFYELTTYNSSNLIKNLTMLHCYVTSNLSLSSSSTANIINSSIYYLSGTSLDITNCYLRSDPGVIYKSQIRNSFFYSTSTSNYLSSNNMVYNCVGYGNNLFSYHTSNNNVTLSAAEFNALFKSTGFYQLTDEAKEKYKGDDGTEVGLYGGSLPYDLRIAKPQITKCNIARKTTADGKLSVDIEVKGVE